METDPNKTYNAEVLKVVPTGDGGTQGPPYNPELQARVPRSAASSPEAIKAALEKAEREAPQVGMIVLYQDQHGSPSVPAIVTARNKDGSFNLTVFGAVTVEHKNLKPGIDLGQFAPMLWHGVACTPFALPEPVNPEPIKLVEPMKPVIQATPELKV